MPDEERPGLPTLITAVWGRLMMEKEYRGAALAALLGHFVAHDECNKEAQRTWSSFLFEAVKDIQSEQRDAQAIPSCSFCGRREPDVRLAAGADAFICDDCVNNLAKFFKSK